MTLDFAGHLLERLAASGTSAALAPYQLVYAFHMPLFFLLAGVTSHRPAAGVWRTLHRALATRVVPVFFWNALGFALLFTADVAHGRTNTALYREGLVRLALGRPLFHFVSWFLVCLFTVEVLHCVVSPLLGSRVRLVGAALLAYAVGWLATRPLGMAATPSLPSDPWYLLEASVAWSFYLVGVLLRPGLDRFVALLRAQRLLLSAAAAACAASLGQNTGPFRVDPPVVLMAASSHGDALCFPVVALAGSLAALGVASLSSGLAALARVGSESAIFLGLAGVFAQFANPRLVGLVPRGMADDTLATLGVCVVLSVISLALCALAAWLLRRFVPQLVGRPARSGPWLPSLV